MPVVVLETVCTVAGNLRAAIAAREGRDTWGGREQREGGDDDGDGQGKGHIGQRFSRSLRISLSHTYRHTLIHSPSYIFSHISSSPSLSLTRTFRDTHTLPLTHIYLHTFSSLSLMHAGPRAQHTHSPSLSHFTYI